MNTEQLFFKLMLRRFLLKQRGHQAFRSHLLGNFRSVPMVVFDTVLRHCIAEGTVTDEYGPKGGITYAWHEEVLAAQQAVHRG
ncbi:MAG: hypothetical protein ACRD3L_10900 [Terriglobales bacterium]